ncbi:ATP-grasp domain-containing protein [Nonomuraea sp. PA05]|uniref:ATP-grasp domain-containing protein n=1 Tax=Nonomuraea sp. PA05 TaxID=2604466 RepID=UPI0011DA7F84|nr:ATP-grasp domain-containing protein [Nonomuraea sp. PA05]TYB51467.1 ATP-grasp domain-containing protein [Nonomuraea sp. PA05]
MSEHVCIVEPLSSGAGLPAAAKALGAHVSVMALDAGPVRLEDSCRPWIDTLIRINVSDTDAVLRAAERLHDTHPITAVIPGFEYFVPLAHRLAARFGLACNDLRHIDALRLKDRMAERARQCGLRIPRTHKVATERQALKAAGDVGYPAVVKAPDTAASCDVYKVRSPEELLECCARIWRRPPEADWEYPVAAFALVQEMITGPEISVETVAFGSGPALVNVTDKLVTDGPHFVELGHTVPSALRGPELARVHRFAQRVHEAYGIRVGAAHIELRLRDGDPVLIEVGARLAGDRIIDLVELATGVDMTRETVRAFLGARAPEREPAHAGGACVRFITAPAAGRFRLDGSAALRSPSVHDLVLPAEIESSGLLRDYRDRHGHLLVRAGTATEAAQHADKCLGLITFTPLPATPHPRSST